MLYLKQNNFLTFICFVHNSTYHKTYKSKTLRRSRPKISDFVIKIIIIYVGSFFVNFVKALLIVVYKKFWRAIIVFSCLLAIIIIMIERKYQGLSIFHWRHCSSTLYFLVFLSSSKMQLMAPTFFSIRSHIQNILQMSGTFKFYINCLQRWCKLTRKCIKSDGLRNWFWLVITIHFQNNFDFFKSSKLQVKTFYDAKIIFLYFFCCCPC